MTLIVGQNGYLDNLVFLIYDLFLFLVILQTAQQKTEFLIPNQNTVVTPISCFIEFRLYSNSTDFPTIIGVEFCPLLFIEDGNPDFFNRYSDSY